MLISWLSSNLLLCFIVNILKVNLTCQDLSFCFLLYLFNVCTVYTVYVMGLLNPTGMQCGCPSQF